MIVLSNQLSLDAAAASFPEAKSSPSRRHRQLSHVSVRELMAEAGPLKGGPLKGESVTTQGSSPHLGFTGLAALDFSCVRGAFGKSISAKSFFFFSNIYWYLRKQETDNRSNT